MRRRPINGLRVLVYVWLTIAVLIVWGLIS